jgi:hypothetical protein
MRKISVLTLGANLLAVNMGWAADLPSHKDAGCNCRLHVERSAVAVNVCAGWAPVGNQASLNNMQEGKLVASNDAGLSKAAYSPGWHAHWAPELKPLREGDLVNVKQGGVAHLGWPDGTSMDLPEGVTRIDAKLCQSKTAPVVLAFSPAIALVGLAAVGGMTAAAVTTSTPNTPPPVLIPNSPPVSR